MATLKERLIEKISKTEDHKTLEEIYRLLDINFDDDIYVLSDEQRAAIKEAEEQIANGQFLTSEQAQKQTEEWLKRKSSGQ
ncbi:MAG: hypothetical protein ACFCUU_15925 [Cyclobacteriaceae bacterium]